MKIGYARVSTTDQNVSMQIDALEKAGCDQIFRDEGVSGAKAVRPGLTKTLDALKPGDVLVVWKLDRLGRSLLDLLTVAIQLKERQVQLQSLSEHLDTSTPAGNAFFQMCGVFAEFQRSIILENQKAGIAAAKRRGKHLGRPSKLSEEQIRHAERMVREEKETVAGMASLLQVDRVTLHRNLKKIHQLPSI